MENCCEHEWLFKQERMIASEYRELCNEYIKLIEEYQKKIKEKDIQISMLLNERNLLN